MPPPQFIGDFLDPLKNAAMLRIEWLPNGSRGVILIGVDAL
jgi:hypothetical protein